MASLEQLAPSAAQPDVQAVLSANAANKAAGKQLLHQLPLWQKMAARARSAVLLMIIYATFWPSVIGTAFITFLCKLVSGHKHVNRLTSKQGLYDSTTNSNGSSSSIVGQQVYQNSAVLTEAAERQQDGLRPAAPVAAAQAPAGADVGTPGTVLVTGGKMTKALHVCRHLKAVGWRVLLLETHKYWHVGSRFSQSVDAFFTVPVPEDEPAEYVQQIVDIAEREGVTMFIPVSSPIASLYDALAAEALQAQARGRECKCWTLSPGMTAMLDNKATFSDYARSLGVLVPDHYVVTSPQQLMQLNAGKVLESGKTFVLKNLSYDSVHRADLVKLPCLQERLAAYVSRSDVIISEQQPWILQEFIQGKEYSCYSLADKGRLVAHSDTLAELSNLNFEHQGHPGIHQWVEQFVTRSNASGQLCFDFMESEADGRLYCIECNPRTSSVITEFHDNPALATAFALPESVQKPVLPFRGSPAAYWWWNEVARLAMNPGYLPRLLRVILNGVDAVFSPEDPLPFLGLHYLQIPMLLLGNLVRGNPWKKVDLCIGKIAELYGD